MKVLVAGDGPERAWLEEGARRLGVADTVLFLGIRRDVPAVLAAVDVAVLSSDYEGSPLSVMEYMAAAKPVVSTRVGGVPELVQEDVHGLLVEPRDPEALAEAVARLLRDPGPGEAPGHRGPQATAARVLPRGHGRPHRGPLRGALARERAAGRAVNETRLLGAALEPLEDYRRAATRTSRLFIELERQFPIVGFVQPALVGPQDWTAKLRAFHPKRDAWRGRSWLSPQAFWQRTLLAERELRVWEGEFDLVFQLQTLFAPGLDPTRPYVIYTDNTYTLTERFYPAWAPLGKRAAHAWRELEQATFRNARVVFGMSEWVCEAIVSDYGCDRERVVAVGAGANSVATGAESKA